MGAMASQITSFTIVYSTVYSGADQRKHQSSANLTARTLDSYQQFRHRVLCWFYMTLYMKQMPLVQVICVKQEPFLDYESFC